MIKQAVTRTWKIYGLCGHRQKVSFLKSFMYDFSDVDKICIIEVKNCDITGTNDYSEITITCDTFDNCLFELIRQITDGIFENSRVGVIEEI